MDNSENPPSAQESEGSVASKQPELNVIKSRDDRKPIFFKASSQEKADYEVVPTSELHFKDSPYNRYSFEDSPSWAKDGRFEKKDLRQRIEPWLTALFQSEHLSLLAGSGITHAIHRLAFGSQATALDGKNFGDFSDHINSAAKQTSEKIGRSPPNLEDQLRVANELLRGLEIQGAETAGPLKTEIEAKLKAFAESILKSERGIATAGSENTETAFNALVNFLMSFASRTGTRDRLNIFTTNYDRVIEAGAEIAGLHLIDRFIGNLFPIFRSSRLDLDMHYNPPGIRGEPRYLEGVARFTKLHGSIDWIQAQGEIRRMGLPFGAACIKAYMQAPGIEGTDAHKLMVYPNSAKDVETAQYPYVELFRDFASALCRPNSTLITYGYSFGDDHINRVIRDMMTIPSTHLVIISRDDNLGQILSHYYQKIGRPSQMSLLLGPELADLTNLTESYLPKSAIDRQTSRMSDLLKMRFGTKEAENKTDDKKEGADQS
jgi:hypothetical protein